MQGDGLAMDGKAAQGPHDLYAGRDAIRMVSPRAAADGVVVG